MKQEDIAMKNTKKNVYVSPKLSVDFLDHEDILTASVASVADFGMEMDWTEGV